MIWTREKPTKPGWYWYKRKSWLKEVVEVVQSESLWVCLLTPELVEVTEGEWAGPIPEPEEPA